jgi:hypothetical protein
MLGRELRRIAKRAPLPLRLMLRAFNPHVREDSHGVTETQRRFTAGALPQTPKASPLTSDKTTGFYRIDRIFLISNPVNHDNPVILSKKHGSYPHLHSRAERGRRATRLNLSAHFASQRLCVKLQTSNIYTLYTATPHPPRFFIPGAPIDGGGENIVYYLLLHI